MTSAKWWMLKHKGNLNAKKISAINNSELNCVWLILKYKCQSFDTLSYRFYIPKCWTYPTTTLMLTWCVLQTYILFFLNFLFKSLKVCLIHKHRIVLMWDWKKKMAVEQLMDDAWYIIIYTYFGTENLKIYFLR